MGVRPEIHTIDSQIFKFINCISAQINLIRNVKIRFNLHNRIQQEHV